MPVSPPFILFDLGGVLIENVGFERLDRLLPRPLGPGALKQNWLAAPSVRRFELGRIDAIAFARELVDDWQLACTADAFLDEFHGWPKGFYPGALDLLDRLRKHHRIGCLTNSNALHWARFDGFAGVFDVALSSHRIGLIKPDAACFEHAIAACGTPAGDILYFDDAAPNVEAARRSGMQAMRAEGFVDVTNLLRRRGLFD